MLTCLPPPPYGVGEDKFPPMLKFERITMVSYPTFLFDVVFGLSSGFVLVLVEFFFINSSLGWYHLIKSELENNVQLWITFISISDFTVPMSAGRKGELFISLSVLTVFFLALFSIPMVLARKPETHPIYS